MFKEQIAFSGLNLRFIPAVPLMLTVALNPSFPGDLC